MLFYSPRRWSNNKTTLYDLTRLTSVNFINLPNNGSMSNQHTRHWPCTEQTSFRRRAHLIPGDLSSYRHRFIMRSQSFLLTPSFLQFSSSRPIERSFPGDIFIPYIFSHISLRGKDGQRTAEYSKRINQ